MKIYIFIPLFLLLCCSLFSQQIDNSTVYAHKIETLVRYHNQLINNEPFQDSLFYDLFTEENLLIDNLYLLNDFMNRTNLSSYIADLKNDGQNQKVNYTINLIPLRVTTTTIWCKRIILDKNNLENIINYKVFKFNFKKIGVNYKIDAIQQVTDTDFDGIEDAIDDCKNVAGISYKKCNGCPDLDTNGEPDNCPKNNVTKGDNLWLYSGITVTGIGTVMSLHTYWNWEKYLKQNNQKDVEKKYSTEKRKFYLSKIGTGVGGAILGSYLFSCVNKKVRKKRLLHQYDTSSYLLKPKDKRKWYVDISNICDNIGVVLRF